MNIDDARKAALDRIDRVERNFKIAFALAALVEVAFLVSFFLLADLGNRNHVLLLISTIATYTIIVLGLFALGAVMRKNTLLILNGLESLGSRQA